MFGILLLAMLSTTAPVDPGISSPGLDDRSPAYSAPARPQVTELPQSLAAVTRGFPYQHDTSR